MVIGGFVKFSLIDYPGKTCAVIFTQGCNFRCRYCHNPELCGPGNVKKTISLSDVYNFLSHRLGKLDAVTITGGEPTLHSDLIDVIKIIKDMEFLIKLDSNGSKPEVIEKIIKERLVDYFAMDVKSPLEDYKRIIGWNIAPELLKRSIDLIINSGIEHEFRTTVVKSLTALDDLYKIAQTVKGAENYFLQKFYPSGKIIDPTLMADSSYTDEELCGLTRKFKNLVKNCDVRI